MGCGVPRRWGWERPGVGAELQTLGSEPGGGWKLRGLRLRGVGAGDWDRGLGDGWDAGARSLYAEDMDFWFPVVRRAGGGCWFPQTRERRGLAAQLPEFSREEEAGGPGSWTPRGRLLGGGSLGLPGS